MEKTLVYHIYLSEDIETNLAYKINAECLKHYINKFDNIKYVMVMDNINDKELRLKGIKYVLDISFSGNIDIIFRPNTEIGEAATVRDYVVNEDNKNEIIFFCHTKGIGAFKNVNEKTNLDSITNWILTMYFYNLNFINEVEDIFMGRKGPIEAFYGTLLMILRDVQKYPIFLPKQHYSGSFCWVNKPFLNKIKDSFSYKDYKFTNRYDAEFFPGYVFKDSGWGKGLTSHNNAKLKLEGMLGAFYNMNDELWDKIYDILGDKEEFHKFKKEIMIKCDKLKL